MSAGTEKLKSSKDIAEQTRTISDLLKKKELHQFAKTPAFSSLTSALVEIARDTSAQDRSRAVALLCKLAAIIKSQRLELGRVLVDVLVAPLEPLNNLGDPDERYYLATFWRFAQPKWSQGYLAAAAVQEDGSEPVRKECIEGLLSGSESLSAAISLLAAPVKELSFDTSAPSKSKARRLRRIVAATRSSFASNPKEPGSAIGSSLRALLRDAFHKTGVPQPVKVQEELAEETLDFLHDIVRARFAFATSSDTYVAIDTIRDWFSASDWEHFVEKTPSGALIARDLEDAVEILVKAGIADNSLAKHLATICGGEKQAQKRLGHILERNPAVSEELTAWLQGREVTKKSVLAAESQATRIDEALANLVLESVAALSQVEHFRDEVLPKMRVLGSDYLTDTEAVVGHLSTLARSVQALGASRSFRISGEIGSVVEFSPLQHELTDSAHFGTRNVRILRPAVTAQLGDGSYRVVRKALVERA